MLTLRNTSFPIPALVHHTYKEVHDNTSLAKLLGPSDEDITHFGHKAWRNHAGSDRKLPPCRLAFIVPKGAVQATGGEKSSTVLLSCEPCELQ